MSVGKKMIKVLVIDDDVRFVDETYNTLSSLGYDVSVCFSPSLAENLIIRQPFHIVLIDCLMPEMDGYSLAKRVQKYFGPSISIILMSAVFKKSDIVLKELGNSSPIVEKPLRLSQLRGELAKAEDKVFASSMDHPLFSCILSSKSIASEEQLRSRLKKVQSLCQGDVLLLFSYLLSSKMDGAVCFFDNSESVEISFSDGFVTHVYENNKEYLIKYFSEKNLLEKKDISLLPESENEKILETLVNSSLISPHQFVLYKMDRLVYFLKSFSRKTNVRFSLTSSRNPDIKIPSSQVIDSILNFITDQLSQEYLKNFIDNVKDLQFVFDEDKKIHWMGGSIPLLKPIRDNIELLSSSDTLYGFLTQLSSYEQFSIHKALFFLFYQGYIKFKQNDQRNLDHFYIRRYQSLHNLFKEISYGEVFSFLGCKDIHNHQELKKVFHEYIRLNHVDKFSNCGIKLKKTIENINGFIVNIYNVISDEEKFNQYKKQIKVKEVQKSVKISEIKNDIFNAVRGELYDKAHNLLMDFKEMPGLDDLALNEVFLWTVVIEVKKENFRVRSKRLKKIFIDVEKIMNKETINSALYYYTLGVLALCERNFLEADMYFKKSLKIDSSFHISKIKQLELANVKFRKKLTGKKSA